MAPPAQPRKTKGHHFSALLQCTHRAWLEYHGDLDNQLSDPPYLRALQAEGHAHEAEVTAREFPEALTIPTKLTSMERQFRTRDAMKAGTPAILQGYFEDEGLQGVGVADVLEFVEASATSATGHIYCVGEIKRAKILQTHHAMQAAWYSDLLGRIQGCSAPSFFFVLGDGQRRRVQLKESAHIYLRLREELFTVRDGLPPGPHLCRSCTSCPWRGVCSPQLVSDRHVSLVPGINRSQASHLRQIQGVSTWDMLDQVGTKVWEELGYNKSQILSVRAAVAALRRGDLVLRQPLHHQKLSGFTPIVLEIPDISDQRRRGGPLLPTAVLILNQERVERIELSAQETTSTTLAQLAGTRRLLFYGGTDVAVFSDLLNSSGAGRMSRYLDLLEVIGASVHAPLLGLELHEVLRTLQNKSKFSIAGSLPSDRVRALGQLRDLLSQSVTNAI